MLLFLSGMVGMALIILIVALSGGNREEDMADEEQAKQMFEEVYCPSCGRPADMMATPSCQLNVPVRTFGCQEKRCETGIFIIMGKAHTPKRAVKLMNEVVHAAQVHTHRITGEAIAMERKRAARN